MSQAVRRPMSVEQFLAWERAQEVRWEFDGEAPVAMTGGSLGHREIIDALARALADRLRGGPCRVYAGDVKVLVTGRVRYPDVVVTCAPRERDADIVPEPVLVAEVLSPTTARTDRFLKLEEYRQTPSIQHYALLEQASADGLVFSRVADGFVVRPVGAGDTLRLPGLGIEVGMAAIYQETGISAGPETGDGH